MTDEDKVWKAAETVLDGLVKIDGLTHAGGALIPFALAAIRAIVHELREGAALNLDPAEVRANIQKHYDAVRSGDDAARAEIHRRFPK